MKKQRTVCTTLLFPELIRATGIRMTRLRAESVGEFIIWAKKNTCDHWTYIPRRAVLTTDYEEPAVLFYYVGFANESDRLMASLHFKMDTHCHVMWPEMEEAVLYLFDEDK